MAKSLSLKERKIRQDFAKDLRNQIALLIDFWLAKQVANKDDVGETRHKIILRMITDEAYASLAWKTLSRSEKLNLPYWEQHLTELRKIYPNIEIKNGKIGGRVFTDEMITKAIDPNLKPLFSTGEIENILKNANGGN